MKNLLKTLGGGVAALFVISAIAANSSPTPPSPSSTPAPSTPSLAAGAEDSKPPTPAPVSQEPATPSPANTSDTLSNDSYYTNSQGSQVHSPAYSSSAPSGASARCDDGTYSFSQSRRGTCSHHGGVSEWL